MYQGKFYLTREGILKILQQEPLHLEELDDLERIILKDLETEGLVKTCHVFGRTVYVLKERP